MPSRTYAVIGAGAVGGFYGARLARAGFDVHFLLRGDYDHVARHGLAVESKDGDFILPRVRAYRRAADLPRCDVVLLALKATQNALLPELLPPAMRDGGVVVVMQNGLEMEDEVAAIAGPGRVAGAACYLCSTKAGPGRIRHLDYGQIVLGEHATSGPAEGDRLRRIADDFRAAGVPVEITDDLVRARWKKLAWNIPFSGLEVALGCDTEAIVNDPHGAALAESVMRDVLAAARACGKPLPDDVVPALMDLTRRMTPYRASLWVDYAAGRPMEIEPIFGNPVRAALRAGYRPILVEALYRTLRVLDRRRACGPARG
jgi:2-dehydropantoate 2-reductase